MSDAQVQAVSDRVRQQETGTADSKQQQAVKKSDYVLAMDVCSTWVKPLAFFAGEFWSFEKRNGWSICTDRLKNTANWMRGKATDYTLLPILQSMLAVPTGTSAQETVYWEQRGRSWYPFELNENEVLFSDGVYNVLTEEFDPLAGRTVFGPMITLRFEQTPEEEAHCNKEIEQLAADRIPDEAERLHFQEVMSTILQPHWPLRYQIVLFGVPHSGKTTLATAIACVPNGRNGLSQSQEATLVRDKFASNSLMNKFANVSDDSPITNKWVGFLKQYTSGNFTVEPKFCKPMSVTPTAKLISTCNEVQSLVDASGAATDRLMLFQFDSPIECKPGSSGSSKMTAVYWSKEPRRQGGVSWLLDGLARLRKRGHFQPPASWTDKLMEAKQAADPGQEEVRSVFKAGSDDSFISSTDIISALGWGGKQGDGMQKAYAYIKAVFPHSKKYVKRHEDGRRERGIRGIELI